jgi:arylformamidase
MIIDISQPIVPGIASFPGDARYEESQTFKIGPGCPVNVARFAMSAHCGSHADAPLHYDAAGKAIGALALEPFLGPCRVIDARGPTPLCQPDRIANALDDPPSRVLLRLMESLPPDRWPAGFRALAPEMVTLLNQRGVKLIGVDTPSIDPETSKELPSHMAAMRADMRILENLVLAHVAPGDYELIALPLRLANLDAAPVRAVLRPLVEAHRR